MNAPMKNQHKERLAAAIQMAGHGLYILPLRPGSKDPYGAREFDGNGWASLITRQPSIIKAWFKERPDMNFGCCPGVGGVIIDLDQATALKPDKENGGAALDELQSDQDLDEWISGDGLIVESPSGGRHLYLKTDRVVGNGHTLPAGIDVRGAGGYVVGPSCRLVRGQCGELDTAGEYKIVCDGAPKAAPGWIMARLNKPGRRGVKDIPLVELDQPQNIDRAREWLKTRDPAVSGKNGNEWTYKTACEVKDRGVSEDMCVQLMLEPGGWNERCDPPWSASELMAYQGPVNNAYTYSQNAAGEKAPLIERFDIDAIAPLSLPNADSSADDDGVAQPAQVMIIPPFERGNKGEGAPTKTLKNALLAADALPFVPALNEFSGKVVFRERTPWGKAGTPLTDAIVLNIRTRWIVSYNLEVAKEHAFDALLAVAYKHKFHPVRDYLNTLEWDGVPRLDTWLVSYCRADDSPYTRAVGRKFLLGAVSRIMRPGCKFDTALVLESADQGKGKSTACKILAVNDDWFTDTLPDMNDKEAAQTIQGRWIIELGELDGMRKSDVTAVKAFISRTADRARFAFGRLMEDYPRTCVFIGTSNDADYLKDASGGRRFWPVAVDEIDLARLQADRDQLWAEALAAFKTGEQPVLPRELWGSAAAEQNARYAEDPWEIALRQHVDTPRLIDDDGNERITVLDKVHTRDLLGQALHKPIERQTQADSVKVRTIMTRRLGWFHRKSLRIGNVVTSGFERPKGAVVAPEDL